MMITVIIIIIIVISNGNRAEWSTIRTGNSIVSRGIWDK